MLEMSVARLTSTCLRAHTCALSCVKSENAFVHRRTFYALILWLAWFQQCTETTVSRQHFDNAEKKFNILGYNCFCFAFDFSSARNVLFALLCTRNSLFFVICHGCYCVIDIRPIFFFVFPWNWNDGMRSHRIENKADSQAMTIIIWLHDTCYYHVYACTIYERGLSM